jgi:hypothetical protein
LSPIGPTADNGGFWPETVCSLSTQLRHLRVQATKYEFLLNLKTAKALGIEVPNSMQLLADEVIE